MGTCGSLQADIPIDSLVASTYGIGLDNVLHFYHFQNTYEEIDLCNAFKKHVELENKNIIPYVAQGSTTLLSHFQQGYHQGITVTCCLLYTSRCV